MTGLDGQREDYERLADTTRERLLRTIDAIDHRRRELLDLRYQARHHAGLAAVVVASATLAAAAGVALASHRVRTRDERLRRERLQALARLWRHPDRVARRHEHSLARRIGRDVLAGAVAYAAVRILQRTFRWMRSLPTAPPPALPPAPEAPAAGRLGPAR